MHRRPALGPVTRISGHPGAACRLGPEFLAARYAWLRAQRYVTGSAPGALALLLATDQSQA
ncbi:hypothetical protein [Streptomyces sp. NPDC087856]|uniref:hypothetical protein n=1 Tax=Streptomyces sp. NPDC087856 TaxID=3365811 RepID=UPI00382E5C0C